MNNLELINKLEAAIKPYGRGDGNNPIHANVYFEVKEVIAALKARKHNGTIFENPITLTKALARAKESK